MSRPVIADLERSHVDITLEALAALALVFLVVATILLYPQLPEEIPEHFNFSGQPDAWGGKGTILAMPVMAILLYAGLTVLARFPHVYNYPWPITEMNARPQYTLARQMLSELKLLVLIIFAYITWGQIATARGSANGLSPWFMVVVVPLIFAVMGFYLFRASRAR